MLTKRPKSFFRQYVVKAGKIAIAAELACLALSYFGWRQLNNNQDLRYYLYKNHNWILEGYYQVGEKISSESQIRQFDIESWQRNGQL